MADPIEWIQCRDREQCHEALVQLDALLEQHAAKAIDGLPPMQGGLAGMVSYDFHRVFESIPDPKADHLETPLLAFGLYDTVLAWDHQQESRLVSHATLGRCSATAATVP